MQLLWHSLRHRTTALQTVGCRARRNSTPDCSKVSGRSNSWPTMQAPGQDLGTNFVELLWRLVNRDADFLLHLTDVNPRWIVQYGEQLAALWARSRQPGVGRLLVPLQSGSEKILRRDVPALYRGRRPGPSAPLASGGPAVRLATHVIVGFPGETAADFEDTLRLLESLPLREIGVFEYSDRPGAEAAELPDRVPEAVIHKRIRRLLARFPKIARHFC